MFSAAGQQLGIRQQHPKQVKSICPIAIIRLIVPAGEMDGEAIPHGKKFSERISRATNFLKGRKFLL